jgi:hypothetical protein
MNLLKHQQPVILPISSNQVLISDSGKTLSLKKCFFSIFHSCKTTSLVTFFPEFVYGITNYLDLYITLPIFVTTSLAYPNGGVGDLLMQLEYAFFQRTTSTNSIQATIVGNITIPTAHISSAITDVISPPIGFDAPSFFIGLTASYLSPQWYAYISPGATLTTPSKAHTKFGNTFVYQAGIGCNLGNPGDITLLGYIEFSGNYIQQNKTCGIKDPNSGGNTIFLGPSIFATKDRWVFWGGIQGPIIQNLNGKQDKERYRTLFSLSITF